MGCISLGSRPHLLLEFVPLLLTSVHHHGLVHASVPDSLKPGLETSTKISDLDPPECAIVAPHRSCIPLAGGTVPMVESTGANTHETLYLRWKAVSSWSPPCQDKPWPEARRWSKHHPGHESAVAVPGVGTTTSDCEPGTTC